jgi:uncharacterized protein YceH (UPF0502 family)
MEALDPVELRILGCLLEKDLATPEYYPMTLNALVNACNQKSNRTPVVAYDEELVSEGVDALRSKGFVSVLTGGSNRVPKYGHRLGEKLNLGRRESAILCELMLRGPQTPGELRSNTARMHRFSDVEEVEARLRDMERLAVELARQPGRREARWAHLLGGEPSFADTESAQEAARPGLESRVAALESEVRELRELLERLRADLGA